MFENGNIDDAITNYNAALNHLPNQPLLMLGLAGAYIGQETPKSFSAAIIQLKKVLLIEPKNRSAWRQLGIAYGRTNQLGLSYLAFAEEAAIGNDTDEATRFLSLAKKHVNNNALTTQKITDLENYLEQLEKEKDHE